MQETAKILIADDTAEDIDFISSLLLEEGYRLSVVTSAAAALHFLKTTKPDLILLNIKLSGADGFSVCQRIKEQPELSDIPVIFLTSRARAEEIKKGFMLGGCDYVVKSFLREELVARIKTHLNISRQSRALSATNHELAQFCSAVSHDLKAPLNVIGMLIASLRAELGAEQSGDAAKLMDLIEKKSGQLVIMINRLLEFSKMCNITPEMEELSLPEMIEEIYGDLTALEPNRDITLECGPLPAITGDEVLVQILLKNVLSNAVKFTGKREKAIITIAALPDNDYNVISVKDNGAGFDIKYADKLFQIFQRLHEEEAFEGSGVGLALVQRIMKRHGGKVEAFGEVDKGAEIRLYFPKRPEYKPEDMI